MKRMGMVVLLASLVLLVGLSTLAQERKQEKKKKAKDEVTVRIPNIEIDLREMERSLEDLEYSMRVLEDFEMPELPPIPEIPAFYVEIPEIEIPEFEFEIPEIEIDIPEIEIPEMHIEIPAIELPEIEIPEIAFDDVHLEGEFSFRDGEWSQSHLFRNLTEKEELRIEALRSVSRDDTDEVLKTVGKVLQEDESAAVRYQAVRLLRRHLDNDKTIDLLGQAAKNDRNVNVKKLAIRLLGKSGSPRAVDILQDIVRQ